jgi:REP element-mobilizing transposase RayT
MPRRARLYLPELPYHIVQRGNNREACFMREDRGKIGEIGEGEIGDATLLQ